jgi:aspartyl-tRNA(Asn)/glutamyl-tRNA(Gln) amidotransferase subunit A
MDTIAGALAALAAGRTTSRALTEAALARAEDKSGEGARVFTKLYRERALAEAEAADRLRRAGVDPAPLAGVPITIKDLFDVAGETTLAGSVVRQGAPPAAHDAVAVRRLRAAGAVIVGRTNMSEFAFSGIGINPHYGTPANAWDRATRRIPGGSSSGAAVSVTDGMGLAAIGTDTGGSVRIPAALNGLVGFKPTARRVPLEGCFPLSPSLDSIGPLARSVADCWRLDAVMAGTAPTPAAPRPAATLTLGVVGRFVTADLDDAVAAGFAAATTRLSKAGARLVDLPLAALEELPKINAKGGLAPPEAWAIHRATLAAREREFDPRVAQRIRMGEGMSAADYIDTLRARADLCARVAAETRAFDAVLCPATAIVAPPIAALEKDDKAFWRANFLMLRNTSAFNFLDRCAWSLPIPTGGAPVGLMVVGETMADAALAEVAAGIEAALAG